MAEKCAICGCLLHRTKGSYARATIEGRSHATKHHFVPERFFGRSANRRGTKRDGIFLTCPWGHEKSTGVFCYECHEELLHNPVVLPEDIELFATLVHRRKLGERHKSASRRQIAGRIKLFQAVISRGIEALLSENRRAPANNSVKRTGAGRPR